MKCIDCPLYKFDGNTFSCAGIPYHSFTEEGMFADPGQPKQATVCVYARVRLRSIDAQIASIKAKWKHVDNMIRCYRVALFTAPDVPIWKIELERRLKEAYKESSELICKELALTKEKSMIVSRLGSLKIS